jgi:hypothetical protein
MRMDIARTRAAAPCLSVPANPLTESDPKNFAEFRTELSMLITKGSTAGLSGDDMADELHEAFEGLTSRGKNQTRDELDPVGILIALHRP